MPDTLRNALAWDLGREPTDDDRANPHLPFLPPGVRIMNWAGADAAIARLADPYCRADIEKAMEP